MATLYTYCIPTDDGAAPNPFWGTCTLVICKPAIRRNAQVGDWIVGTGSVNSPIGDISESVVYAMRVTEKMTMAAYDQFAQLSLPEKLPDLAHSDPRRRRGDAIYDFSTDPPTLRPSVHGEENRETDLSGVYALLSTHFYYFGDKPVALPKKLQPIIKQGQNCRGPANAPYFDAFIAWLEGLGHSPGDVIGTPQLFAQGGCGPLRCAEATHDETCGGCD